MKEIKLTQGKIALVDDEDFEYLNQWKWHAVKKGNAYYARRTGARKLNNGKCFPIYMHRVILGLSDPKIEVDHIDHNGCNNCKNNLRIATSAQNKANRSSNKNSSSKYVGVRLFKRNGRWQARIQKNNKQYHIGYFKNDYDAALAYNKKAIELHGEFANLNKISI